MAISLAKTPSAARPGISLVKRIHSSISSQPHPALYDLVRLLARAEARATLAKTECHFHD